MKNKQTFISVLMVAMAFGTAWAIRGKFGHEQGAAWAGAIGAISVVLVAKRTDWYNRVFKIVLAAAVGWGVGGMISYGVVVGYGKGNDFFNVYYGLMMLFVIGCTIWLPGRRTFRTRPGGVKRVQSILGFAYCRDGSLWVANVRILNQSAGMVHDTTAFGIMGRLLWCFHCACLVYPTTQTTKRIESGRMVCVGCEVLDFHLETFYRYLEQVPHCLSTFGISWNTLLVFLEDWEWPMVRSPRLGLFNDQVATNAATSHLCYSLWSLFHLFSGISHLLLKN